MTGSAPATGDGGPAAGRQVRHRGLVVGFDLDLTPIDSRQGVAQGLRALAAETGVNMDVDLVTSRLGPPLEVELAEWFPAADVPAMARRYRQMYRSWAIERTPLLPGAAEAVDAVRAAGGRVIIVTSKHESNARAHLEHTGLIVDDLVGLAYRDGRAMRYCATAHGGMSATMSLICDRPAPPPSWPRSWASSASG